MPFASPTHTTSGSGTFTPTATARSRTTRPCSTARATSSFASANSRGSQSARRLARKSRATAAAVAPQAAARVQTLAEGFHNISGGAVAPSGDFYFVDAKWNRIYRWSVRQRMVTTVADAPLEPVNLAFDKAGHLLVVLVRGERNRLCD